MKTIKITILLLLVLVGFSKAQYIQDVQGRPVFEKSYVDVKGSPFLFNNWILGDVKLENGATHANVPLKYNIVDDILYFRAPKDSSLLEFVIPVIRFKFNEAFGGALFSKGFPAIENFTNQSYYQVLYDGKVKLLKKQIKTILENKPYNSATTEKSFLESNLYFALKGGEMQKLRPAKKSLLQLFTDKEAQVEDFIKKEKIDFKSDEDLAKVFKYYDSL